jgi:hypothetical protein
MAYVSLIYGGDKFLDGIILTGLGLRKQNTKYDLVCLLTEDCIKYKDIINIIYDKIIVVPYITPRNIKDSIKISNNIFKSDNYIDIFTKLNLFNKDLLNYDKIIFIDSDLIPIKKWEIYPTKEIPYFRFAILQEKARNEWITEQYKNSIYALTNYNICEPDNEGTFVPHHFIIYHHVLNDLIKNIETISNECWIKSIINLSYNFYRFSEYRTISSFMKINYPNLLKYHSFRDFGKYGKRIRIPTEFLKEMENFLLKINTNIIDEISYDDFIKFVNYKYNDEIPSYIQIEHI